MLFDMAVDKEVIKGIKTDFFALRNGEVASRLRKAGSPYKIIFGLLVPQLEQIAAGVVHTSALAEALWKNKSTRESRLLATMIYPLEEFSLEKAERWAEEFDTMELTDMLCFRLVRNVAGAEGLVAKNFDSNDVCRRYFALRLAMNLLIIGKLEDIDAVRSMAEKEYAGNFSETKYLSFQIIEEIDFLKAK